MSNKQYVAMPAEIFNEVVGVLSDLPYSRVSSIMDQVKNFAKVVNLNEEEPKERNTASKPIDDITFDD